MVKRLIHKIIFVLILHLHFVSAVKSYAQTVQYCRENVFANSPDDIQLVADIAGNTHLISFINTESPRLFIYDKKLQLINQLTLPFVFPEKASLRMVPFSNFYYLSFYNQLSRQYHFFKISADGNCTDMTEGFRKLLKTQTANVKLGFQLMPYKEQLWMVYHTALDNIYKNTVVMVQADSLLQPVFVHKVQYDFKQDEEKLAQEILVFGKYLIVLKIQQSGSALELMKVNLATGFTISNSFRSSGFIYSQAGCSYNEPDTSVTVTSLLTEPGFSYNPKQYVFVSRLNKILQEQVPFTLLKKQFKKNTSTNFLLVDGKSRWVRFRRGRGFAASTVQSSAVTIYQDQINPLTADAAAANTSLNNLLTKMTNSNAGASYTDEVGVRFSLLDKNLQLTTDSLVPNTKDSYTIRAAEYTRYESGGKEYLLIAHQFYNRKNGLLLVNADDAGHLVYTYLRVNEKNNYLLSKAKHIAGEGIVIPYVRRKEMGFIKISNN